jgi:hypothetical protein
MQLVLLGLPGILHNAIFVKNVIQLLEGLDMSACEGIKQAVVFAVIAEGSKGLGIAAIRYFVLDN